MKTDSITIRIEPELKGLLRTIGVREGMTISEIVHVAITNTVILYARDKRPPQVRPPQP